MDRHTIMQSFIILEELFQTVNVPSCFCAHLSDGEEEESAQQPQQVASALVNSSPKVPHVEAPNAVQPTPNTVQPAPSSRPECFDVTLQRKDNEGFGFVILTSKNKPPAGGQKSRKKHLAYNF